MNPQLNAIMIYAKDIQKTADFYQQFFGFSSKPESEGLVELVSPDGSTMILIHQAAKSLKLGQAGVKLVFSVLDIEAFKAQSLERGLAFSSTHQANGYQFANAKDPDNNSVSISSRAYRSIA
ncbi:putative enzyme related to lactoylglutathione lyase [Undibacterium sp. GrIS 1.8]|uniref:VOC family protein n=1 Tax=unclassified Undibacterium TaxID=2630295 RepID=UPI003392F787